MEKRVAAVLPNLLGAAFAVLLLAANAVHAQSSAPTDKKDQEIELLKSQIKELEGRVRSLEELAPKVKVIDRKVDAQEGTQLANIDRNGPEHLKCRS
jgi:hypothetical protein